MDSVGEGDSGRCDQPCEIRLYPDRVTEEFALGPDQSEFAGLRNPAVYVRIVKPTDLSGAKITAVTATSQTEIKPLPATIPGKYIHTYLAKRRLQPRDRWDIPHVASPWITDLTILADNLHCRQDPEHPSSDEFAWLCEEALGFQVSTFVQDRENTAGLAVGNIQIEGMGERIMPILNLLMGLCGAHNKLFLIEQIENDKHPRALKALLRMIVEKSADNQFVISTNSDIVLKYLGDDPQSKVHAVSMEFQNQLPTSTIRELPGNPIDRRTDLLVLGFEFDDFSFQSA